MLPKLTPPKQSQNPNAPNSKQIKHLRKTGFDLGLLTLKTLPCPPNVVAGKLGGWAFTCW